MTEIIVLLPLGALPSSMLQGKNRALIRPKWTKKIYKCSRLFEIQIHTTIINKEPLLKEIPCCEIS